MYYKTFGKFESVDAIRFGRLIPKCPKNDRQMPHASIGLECFSFAILLAKMLIVSLSSVTNGCCSEIKYLEHEQSLCLNPILSFPFLKLLVIYGHIILQTWFYQKWIVLQNRKSAPFAIIDNSIICLEDTWTCHLNAVVSLYCQKIMMVLSENNHLIS